jgi:hypothetical protein
MSPLPARVEWGWYKELKVKVNEHQRKSNKQQKLKGYRGK